MKLIDVNILLYATNRDSPRHRPANAWLDETLSGEETIALPWIVLLGFLRITTHPRIMKRPLTPTRAIDVVGSWLGLPQVFSPAPGDEHWRILRELLTDSGTGGNLTTDAHLAALAIELGAELCSTDRDFGRFHRVRWVNPLD